MKNGKQVLIIIILAVLTSSCSVMTSERTAPTPSVTSVSPTALQTKTNTPSNATKTPVARIDTSCWPIKPLQEGNGFKGSFVYAHYDSSPQGVTPKVNGLFAWNLSSFSSKQLDLNTDVIKLLNAGLLTSRSLANSDKLTIMTENNLIFVSPQNVEVYPLPDKVSKDGTIRFPIYTPPDGRLLVHGVGIYDYKEGVGFTDTYYIFDPATKAISMHKVFLPDLYIGYQTGISIYYSPDMKYVLYRSLSQNHSVEGFTLYDIEKNKVVWVTLPQTSNLRLTGGDPHWLPNTDVITAEYEDKNTGLSNYYLVSLDGTISPINDLDHAPGTSIGDALKGIAADWSPNGRYLVSPFYITFIWDNYAQTWYKPCLPDEQKSVLNYMPLWSSNGNYFIAKLAFVEQASPKIVYVYKMYILDLLNKVIYELPENVNQREFTTLYKDGRNNFIGWVNWKIP